MATLEKLKGLDDTQIQNWLRKVGQENAVKLGIALMGADEDVRNLIYRNMSPRAAGVMKDELEKNQRSSVDEVTIKKYAAELEKLI